MIGLKRGTVLLCPHETEWEVNAAETICKLKKLLGAVAADIQHIGSTSIKGLMAKPIVDIAVAVYSFNDIMPLMPMLEENGFIFRHNDDDENQLLFVCGDFKANTRTHHIHVVIYNSSEWNNYLKFRDTLNSDAAKRLEYEQLKLNLMQLYPNDRVNYTLAKADFIASIINV